MPFLTSSSLVIWWLTTYSMFNLMIDPRDNEMWIDAIKGKYFGGQPFTRTEWDQLLGHCQVRQHYIIQHPYTSSPAPTGCLRLPRLRIRSRTHQSLPRRQGRPHQPPRRRLVPVLRQNHQEQHDLTPPLLHWLLRHRRHGPLDTDDTASLPRRLRQ